MIVQGYLDQNLTSVIVNRPSNNLKSLGGIKSRQACRILGSLRKLTSTIGQNRTRVLVGPLTSAPPLSLLIPRKGPGYHLDLCAWRRDTPRLRDFGFAALGGLHSAFYHPRDPALVSLLGGCQQQMSEQNALMFKICLPSSLKFAV